MNINYYKYEQICKRATEDDEVFKVFKNHPDFTYMLEHVTHQQGLEYIEEIKKLHPKLLKHIECFATNDSLGSPQTYWYSELNMNVSPTTLRYIKVLADLMVCFGDLSGLDIVEIGVGYGGQCKIINDYFVPKSYTLIDVDDVLALANRYLICHGIENIRLRGHRDASEARYDLCLSNYAFTEISRQNQDFYAWKIVKNSQKGYMTCNFLDQRSQDGGMSRDEIFNLKENGFFVPEEPLTSPHNAIYLWK